MCFFPKFDLWKKAPFWGPFFFLFGFPKILTYINPKMDKTCRKCGCKLVLGENITPSSCKNHTWTCRSCRGISDKKGRPQIHDSSTLKQRIKEGNTRRREKESAGIYCFKKEGKIIYIGESKQPLNRREGHLWGTHSERKEDLTGAEWEMLEYIEDHHQRLIREFELICEHKPILNFPYRYKVGKHYK